MGLKDYVLDTYLKNIIHEENGKKYIYEEDFEKLNADEQEKIFILQVMKSENIIIIIKKIEQQDRPTLVRDYNYGDVQTNDLGAMDLPVKSTVEYDESGNVVFEEYEELELFLDSEFIPKNLKIRQKKDPVTGEMISESSIQLNHIVALQLSEKEVQFVFKYLNDLHIMVHGVSPDINNDLEIDNYKYFRTFKESKKTEYDETVNDEKRIEQYQNTKDYELRNKIVENNMRLASFVAYKYSIITGINIHELESYAYEGLIYAIENFDVNKGCKFSTYAVPCIRGFVLSGIPKIQGFYISNFYYDYISCKNVVEETQAITLEEEPKLLKDIYELMKSTGKLRSISYLDFANLITISQPKLQEEVDAPEDEFAFEDMENIIDNESLKQVLEKVLDTLTPREKEVIELRFGLKTGKPMSLEQVGKHFDVTRERIRQIEAKAIRKLRHPSRSKALSSYL